MYIIAILIILVIIIVILTLLFLFLNIKNKNNLLPLSRNGLPLDEIETPNPFPLGVYFPLLGTSNFETETLISNFENELLSQNRISTLNEIKSRFVDLNQRDKGIEFLRENGTVLMESESGTCCVWIPSQSFLDDNIKKVYYGINFIPVSVNDRFTLPFGMVVNNFNVLYQQQKNPMTIPEWNEKLNLRQQSLQPTGYGIPNTFNPILTEESLNQVIFAQNVISEASLIAFTQYFNEKYSTSYSNDYFFSKVIFINFSSLTPVVIPLTNNSYEYDLENHLEILTDVFISLEFNPSSIHYCLLPIFDVFPFLYYSIENNFGINTVTSSLVLPYKFNQNDYSRIKNESRFISMLGVLLFSVAGDQGSWLLFNDNTTNTEFSLEQPDSLLNVNGCIGDGVIKVGGINYTSNQGKISIYDLPMSLVTTHNLNFSMEPVYFSSGGGFIRGYPRPYFKNEAVESYRYPNSVCEHLDKTGKIFTLDGCEVDTSANVNPDVSFICSYSLLGSSVNVVFGTSVATPSLAGFILQINQLRKNNGKSVIPCLYRILYSSAFDGGLTNDYVGRLSMVNYLGFKSDSSARWSPIFGRGGVNPSTAKDLLLGDLAIFT